LSDTPPEKPLLRALTGHADARIPIWLMRQAGRYLPEYRAVRAQAGSFLDLCFTPDLAAEVTLQPVRRFGLNAAILFSDILVVPHALGQTVWFEEGSGPRLEALKGVAAVDALERPDEVVIRLAPVYEAVGRVAEALAAETALIGFAGAPWTVATYMIEGASTRDFLKTKVWAYRDPDSFGRLVDVLVEATVEHLCAQVDAGAEVLQLFESWAGVLAADELERWSLEPCRQIVAGVKERHPAVPCIIFPRGAGASYQLYAEASGADCLGLDQGVPLDWAASALQPSVCLQGNLDPGLLVAGGAVMEAAAQRVLEILGRGPFVFNLGHGVVPQTPPDHVARLVELVQGWSSAGGSEA
jgi:uroporphyrinogen decarboxylase